MFDRVPSEFKPVIEKAWSLLPEKVRTAVAPHFLCGIDPCFVGLHGHRAFNEDWAAKGWGYDFVPHACYSHHSADGVPRVVFPQIAAYAEVAVETVLHEVGHLYDETLGWTFDAPPTTDYSLTNREERFAEAFQVILQPPDGAWAEWAALSESVRPMRELMGVA